MNLNLGSGYRKIAGWTNVDKDEHSKPDIVWDLEITPWPWKNESVNAIKLIHTLEHLGRDTMTYLAIWKELWRISKHNTTIDIIVPHWLHENFAHDPTHVRAITPISVAMFDQERNNENLKTGGAETKLGLMCGIDFRLTNVRYALTEPWKSRMAKGEIDSAKMEHIVATEHNACEQIEISCVAVKPARFSPSIL